MIASQNNQILWNVKFLCHPLYHIVEVLGHHPRVTSILVYLIGGCLDEGGGVQKLSPS